MVKGVAAPIIFKKRMKKKKREREVKKGKKLRNKKGKIKKTKNIITNNLNAVYKWVKTDKLLRGNPLAPNFLKSFTNATISINAPTPPC